MISAIKSPAYTTVPDKDQLFTWMRIFTLQRTNTNSTVIVIFVNFYVYLYVIFVNCLHVCWVCQFVSLQLNLIKTLARSSGI